MKFLVCAALIGGLLAACSSEDDPAGPDGIRDFVEQTNLDSSNFPWRRTNTADGQLKRWDVSQELIPVKLNGDERAVAALDEIESTLEMTLFDRESIANVEDEAIERGLIVSEGTAVGPGGRVDGNTCGNVADGPRRTGRPINWYDSRGEIDTRLYINLGSDGCTPGVAITIHEFGHAMGLGQHFAGFGDGPPINANFWNTLATLYASDIGVSKSGLEIHIVK